MTEVFTINKHQIPFIFSPFFTVPFTQLFVWLVGRNDVDAEWWKALIFGSVASCSIRGVAFSHRMSGDVGVILALAVTVIPMWFLAGYFYEISGWRRLALSVSCSVFVFLALFFERFPIPFPWID